MPVYKPGALASVPSRPNRPETGELSAADGPDELKTQKGRPPHRFPAAQGAPPCARSS